MRALRMRKQGGHRRLDREINILKAEWTINQQYYAVTPPAVPRSAVSARKIEIATDALHKHLTNDPEIIKRPPSLVQGKRLRPIDAPILFCLVHRARPGWIGPEPQGWTAKTVTLKSSI